MDFALYRSSWNGSSTKVALLLTLLVSHGCLKLLAVRVKYVRLDTEKHKL